MIGHIYRIIHLESDIQYVGSTFNEPRKRWQMHKSSYNKWKYGKFANIAIYPYFNEHGIDKFKLIPIKSYEVVDRQHLEAYEQLWISKLNCVNIMNTIKIKNMSATQYREMNRLAIRTRDNEFYQANKERIKDKKRSKVSCECGATYSYSDKARHIKTLKHQRRLQELRQDS